METYIRTEDTPSGAFGFYIQTSTTRGIKFFFREGAAKEELKVLQKLESTGITPKPYGLVKAKIGFYEEKNFEVFTGLEMEHIEGEDLSAIVDYPQVRGVLKLVNSLLISACGKQRVHWIDNHGRNARIQFVKRGKEITYYRFRIVDGGGIDVK